MKEYTKEELLEQFKQNEVDGKISHESLAELIFDTQFPNHLYDNAKETLIDARDDENRFKELGQILYSDTNKMLESQKKVFVLKTQYPKDRDQIGKLKSEIKNIEEKNIDEEREFEEIQKRRNKRKGENNCA